MADFAKKIASGKALGIEYHIHDRSGTIEGSETRAETEVTGSVSGGGGFSHSGSGFNNPVSGSIQSKTTRYQNIYLKDEDGDEHTIELVNFVVPCKQGHKLTFFIVRSGDNKLGPYFQAFNHSTRQHYEYYKAVRSEMFPTRWFMIALGVIGTLIFLSSLAGSDSTFGGAILVTVFSLLLFGAVFWVAGSVLGAVRARAVKNNPAFKTYLASLGRA
jgi:hypothetical protein